MKKVYIAGKISGLERDEYLANFAKAEELLRAIGYEPVNPTRFIVCRWQWLYRIVGYNLTLLYDLWHLLRCHHIYKIPGWHESHGANMESCAAYHFGIFPLPERERGRIDKKMCKFMEKRATAG